MKIVLATPLFPPEIAEAAPYAKELAARLGGRHEVVVIAYVRLPEPVPNVRIVAISKRYPLPVRVAACFFALLKEARSADVLYAINGASVEAPASLAAVLTRTPLILCIGDRLAHERAGKSRMLGRLEQFAARTARKTITASPLPRPEILPLEPPPIAAQDAYRASWDAHLAMLETTFHEIA